MELKQALYGRRAVRDFTAAAVDDATLRKLIDAAIQAPSAVNAQAWSFTVVRNQNLLGRISSEAKAHMLRTTPAVLLSHHFEVILNDPKFHIFYHAPVMILISSRDDSMWAHFDCALAAENLMLAAYAEGLGTCWIGFAQGWLATAEGKAALKLPATSIPVAPIIVGHPKAPPPPVARKAPDIHWIDS